MVQPAWQWRLLGKIASPGKPAPILAAVWGAAHTNDTQYLRVYIGQFRQKIEANSDDPAIIKTEPGIGYRLASTD